MTLPFLRTKRLQTALILLILLTVAIGVIITPLEKKFGRLTTFQTTGDGMWWAVTTVTSVGYGDYYPVTTPGRILGGILSILGVTMFGIVIALVTIELFRNEQLFYWKRTVERFDRIEELLKKMERKQGYDLEEKLKESKEHGNI
jgi:voltage-gated potassium channel